MKEKTQQIVYLIIVAIILITLFFWMMPKAQSISNGGPTFPDGCWNQYPYNQTHGGQVVSVKLFDRDQCCTTIRFYNGKEKQCWERIQE